MAAAPELRAHGQRPRADRQRAPRLVPLRRQPGSSYIEPGSPWQNPFVESFGGRVRDEVLAVEAFDSLLEAKTVIEEWRNTYNTPEAAQQSRLEDPGRLRRRLRDN